MTIKTESDHQGRPYVPGTGQSFVTSRTIATATPEVNAESTASANEPDIPFATAVLVGDSATPSAFNPSYVGPTPATASAATTNVSTTTTSQNAGAAAAIASDNNDNHYTSQTTATPQQQPAYPSGPPPSSATPPNMVVGTSQPINAGARPPPPGIPPGGRWVRMRHIGNNTWVTCGIISGIFCVLMCLPCGLWAFLCPCDEQDAYLVNGKLFDSRGGMIGSAHSRNYHG